MHKAVSGTAGCVWIALGTDENTVDWNMNEQGRSEFTAATRSSMFP